MKAIGANVALRWLTGDDPAQVGIARDVLRSPVLIPLTVLMEIIWTLRRTFRYDRAALNAAITTLVDLDTVSVAAEAGVRWALDRHAEGADLPDMLHLVASRGASAFVTFERRLAEKAGPSAPLPVETLA